MPKKFDRCVKEVKKKSPNTNPYAICNAALKKEKPKDGNGAKLDKAKATLKKYAIPIAGVSVATIIAIAAALNKKDNGEAFVFHSLSDLSPEEFKRLMEGNKKPEDSLIFRGDGERLEKAKAKLKEWAIPIGLASAAIIISIASTISKNKTDKNDRAILANFLAKSGAKLSGNAIKNMFAHVNKDKFRNEYPDIARKIRLRGSGLIADAREFKLIGLGEPKERPKRRKANAWVQHVRAYGEKHDLCYRDALKGAGATYVRPKK